MATLTRLPRLCRVGNFWKSIRGGVTLFFFFFFNSFAYNFSDHNVFHQNPKIKYFSAQLFFQIFFLRSLRLIKCMEVAFVCKEFVITQPKPSLSLEPIAPGCNAFNIESYLRFEMLCFHPTCGSKAANYEWTTYWHGQPSACQKVRISELGAHH